VRVSGLPARAAFLLLMAWGLWGCAGARAPRPALGAAPSGRSEVGLASWYGEAHQGRRTASGEIYDKGRLTAAHRTLPLGTRLRVTNLENGRIVRVRVNDRGPYVGGRVLDLSEAAARALGMREDGVVRVRLDVEGLLTVRATDPTMGPTRGTDTR
jgi:rare lipoprotein A